MKSSNYSLNKSSICLFLLRNNDTQVLLQKRGKNSSFAPNMWEAGAAGHVDKGESVLDAVLHEAKEELCISVKKNDLQFGSVTNKRSAITGEIFYIFSFFCRKWNSTPKIGEPDKCSEIKWFSVKKLPSTTISDRKAMVKNFFAKKYFSVEWNK